MITVGSEVRVIGAYPHNWPDPSMRRHENEIIARYLGRVGEVVGYDVRNDYQIKAPYTVRFQEPPVWDRESQQPETMPSEMRFREFELEEVCRGT